MSKIVKNTTGSDIVISDTGVTVLASNQYTIPANDYLLWAASDDVITEIGSGDIVVNDGSVDLGISDGTDLIKGIFQKQRIIGSTDSTLIGNIGDRLKVTSSAAAGGAVSCIPADKTICASQMLMNTGSGDMTVDGSTTSVVFSGGPPSGEVWYVHGISIYIEDPGTNDSQDFGAIMSGLTNGLKVDQIVDSTAYTLHTFKSNLMLALNFTTGSHFVGQPNGFINTANAFMGSHPFKCPVTLTGDNSDKIQSTVQDDLGALSALYMTLTYFKVVG